VSAVLDAGFVFWGVFVVSAATVVGYLVWMRRTEGDG
jgi:uncharacterized membrane protein